MLRGRVEERDARLIAPWLDRRGVAIARVELVGDDVPALVAAVRRMLDEGLEIVCVTGGLGPTHDDLTMEAVAAATGRALRVDPDALAMVRAAGQAPGLDPEVAERVARKQASLPEGARPLPPAGTAPGCLLEHGGTLIAVLPGPPWELERMWGDAVAAEPLAGALARAPAPWERVLRLYRVPESRLVAALEALDAAARDALRLGVCARDAELEVTVRHEPGAETAADALEAVLAAAFGDALYSRDGREVDRVVADALVAAGQTVAVAESCTGGLIGARLTELPGSSRYVVGGVVAYADAVKTALLGVDPEIIRRHGAVSAECAAAMAEGARARTGADWALSATGIAGPGGGTAVKPVGLVFLGRAGPGGTVVDEHRLRGDRAAVRERAAALALHLLRLGDAPRG